MPADLSSLLKRRTFGRGTLRPFEEDGEIKGLAYASFEDETTFDESGLWAKFLISTPSVDRALDVVPPKSLDFTDFEKNAIVLWNHGQHPAIPFPLGTSIDPTTKKLAVDVTDRSVWAKCFFGKGVPQSEDMFKLVSQGIVKAASIHMVAPIEAKERAPSKKGGRPGYEILKASIAEWSLVDIPCNQDACRKAALTGRLLNEALTDEVHEIVKGMAASLPKAKMLGKGWAPTTEPEAAAEIKVALDTAGEPGGAALLAGLHSQLKGMLSTVKAAAVENPTVLECLTDLAKELASVQATVKGGYAAAYPDGMGLDTDEAPDAEAITKGIVATLEAGGSRWKVKGHLHTLKSFAAADNLRPSQREALAEIAEFIGKAAAQGETAITKGGSSKPKETDADTAAVIAKLAKTVEGLMAKIAEQDERLLDSLPFNGLR